MEQLNVTNFLVIKEAKFDVARVNVIIGSQATGKSILIKLLYLFREVISQTFLTFIENQELEEDYFSRIKNSFKEYFPKYTWANKEFEIIYIRDEIEIKITKTSLEKDIEIEFSQYFSDEFKKLKKQYEEFLNYTDEYNNYIFSNFDEFEEQIFYKELGLYKYFINESIFIPANRSFFANIQKNIFSFLNQGIEIDSFMKKFGSQYENTKRYYSNKAMIKFLEKEKSYPKIKRIVDNILNGSYLQKNNKDWIESNGNIINLCDASSGQQESLPMLLILSIYAFFDNNKQNIYFVEEPEAHLFPTSQKEIVSLFGFLYNQNQDIIITTHSPYILVALNNLILANDVKKEKGSEAIKNLVDEEFCIEFDDVRAYTIEDGKLITILDKETRLIGTNIIDSVSDDFSNTFDDLLSLQQDWE